MTGPAQKSSKYGTGPPQQEKMTKYTGPAQDTETTIFFQHSRPNHLFKYAIYCSNTDTISHFPPFKNSPTHSNASPGLVFHLEHCSHNHGLLVVVDIVDHVLCMLKELIQVIWHGAINQPRSVSGQPPASSFFPPKKINSAHRSVPAWNFCSDQMRTIVPLSLS